MPEEVKIDPADLPVILEMARIALDNDGMREQIADEMDLSDDEVSRLSDNINKALQ